MGDSSRKRVLSSGACTAQCTGDNAGYGLGLSGGAGKKCERERPKHR